MCRGHYSLSGSHEAVQDATSQFAASEPLVCAQPPPRPYATPPPATLRQFILTVYNSPSPRPPPPPPPPPWAICAIPPSAALPPTPLHAPHVQHSLHDHHHHPQQAAHPDTDSAFEIQPPSLTVQVGQGDASLSDQFVVTGFSVSGRVVDPAGNGVPSVSIRVNGKERTSTDLNGRWGHCWMKLAGMCFFVCTCCCVRASPTYVVGVRRGLMYASTQD